MAGNMRTNKKTKGRFFIAGAIKHPGALIDYVSATFGPEGFTQRGTIKQDILDKIASGSCPVCAGTPERCVCPTKLTRQRVNLALRLRSFNK